MTHWVVDCTLGRQAGSYEALIEVLERLEVAHTLVRKPPLADYVVGFPASDDPAEIARANDTPIELAIEGPVFVVGKGSMLQASARYGWSPGYIDAPDQGELIERWGMEVLNHDAFISELADARAISARFFARPVEDSKSFAGEVYEAQAWEEWRAGVLALDDPNSTLSPATLVMLAPLKTIYAEYRLYVIGSEIVTGSRYKLGDTVSYSPDLDPAMLDYARARIAAWSPRRAFCLDIAHVAGDGDGPAYKVIETNALSSSGFYACDLGRFVGAINAEFG